MRQQDYETILGFSDQWFYLGIATEGSILIEADYASSVDKSSEHYRYGIFCRYLSQHRPVSASGCEALYDLGEADPDDVMGGAMMADILNLPECPETVFAKAFASGRKHLVRIVERKRLLSEMQSSMTAATFNRLLEGDSAIHRAMLEQVDLLPEQLQVLAEQGADKAVRHMASMKLRRRSKAA